MHLSIDNDFIGDVASSEVSRPTNGHETRSDACGLSLGGSPSTARFNLRKRAVDCNERRSVNIASYNSAFLSGLFADVAKASEQPEDTSSDSLSSDLRSDSSASIKKSRVSLTRAVGRSRRSYGNLADAVCLSRDSDKASSPKPLVPASPVAVENLFSMPKPSGSSVLPDIPLLTRSEMTRHDSLAYQLNCVSSIEGDLADTTGVCQLAFPNLPATVSDTVCTDLTRATAGLATAETETFNGKEGYGWFVVMEGDDDDEQERPTTAYKSTSSADLLAFRAPTAPKCVNHDAEVEWAQAADTVDDVLGDFF